MVSSWRSRPYGWLFIYLSAPLPSRDASVFIGARQQTVPLLSLSHIHLPTLRHYVIAWHPPPSPCRFLAFYTPFGSQDASSTAPDASGREVEPPPTRVSSPTTY